MAFARSSPLSILLALGRFPQENGGMEGGKIHKPQELELVHYAGEVRVGFRLTYLRILL